MSTQRLETEKEAIQSARKMRIAEIDRLQTEVNALDDRYDAIEEEEETRCRECGHTPETGACFYCKMD